MLMFVELPEASSLYSPCVTGGIVCRRELAWVAAKSCRIWFNFGGDVTRRALILLEMFCAGEQRLFPPKIVCLLQMLQHGAAISHSVTCNSGRTSRGTESHYGVPSSPPVLLRSWHEFTGAAVLPSALCIHLLPLSFSLLCLKIDQMSPWQDRNSNNRDM